MTSKAETYARRRREKRLAETLASSFRMSRVRNTERRTSGGGALAVVVPMLLLALGLLALIGIMREYLS